MPYSYPEAIRTTIVEPGSLAVFWLGQAGFSFKTHEGKILYIDPYLSDSVERLAGFRRLCPSVASPEDVEADAVLVTHHHEDHLDVDTLPVIAARTSAQFVAPPQSAVVLAALGIDRTRISRAMPGSPIELGFCSVLPVFADHGTLAPDAVGFVVDFGCARVYFTGDTAYRSELMAGAILLQPDLVIPVINGAYGNMDSHEAALLIRDSGAKNAIPCHFWTFMEHGGDPSSFRAECGKLCPTTRVTWLTPGKSFILLGACRPRDISKE